jgi:hypothetical protein
MPKLLNSGCKKTFPYMFKNTVPAAPQKRLYSSSAEAKG